MNNLMIGKKPLIDYSKAVVKTVRFTDEKRHFTVIVALDGANNAKQ
jgi:hypothetical protein